MILSCPACRTTFMVSDAIFGTKPRRVRCSKCQHEWRADPPAFPEEPVDLTPPPESVKPIPAGSNVPAPRKEESLWDKYGSKALTAAGALLGLYLFAIILNSAGLNVMPSSFIAPDPMDVLALEDVKTRYENQGNDVNGEASYALVVEGTVRNTGSQPIALPPVVIETKNKDGKIIASATASLQTQSLPPGQSTGFLQTFDNPPEDLADITVAFKADEGDNKP